METKTIKLFDANNRFVANFDEEIENILISIHGENYYDTDEELVNTNMIPLPKEELYQDTDLDKTMEFLESMVDEDRPKIKIVENTKIGVSIKDFIPVLFFILVFTIIVFAGYYFLNTIDLLSLLT